MSELPERAPLVDIHAFFAEQGLRLDVHVNAPPKPPESEWRSMPSEVRSAYRKGLPSHWVDLQSLKEARVIHPWYGSGDSEEDAVRSARARWRIEQEGGQDHRNRYLP